MLPLILGLSGLMLTPDERAFFREAAPAGFILFGRNVETPGQLRALTGSLRALMGSDLPILIDQEGGRVARLRPPHWPAFPPAAAFGDLYRRAPISGMEAARVNAVALGAVLAEAGINVNCAPSLDLAIEGADAVIGDRALGADPLQVAALGRMVLEGLAEAGVAGVAKHMPGHGRARADSHKQLPVVDASQEELAADVAPFAKLARHAKWGMTAHIRYAAWDAERPATLSSKIVQEVIRDRIGFEGLLLTDDITMGALDGSHADRAQAALAAGCDLVLHCSGDLAEGEQVAAALSPAPAEIAERIAAALPPRPEQRPDLAAALAKRDALLAHGTAA